MDLLIIVDIVDKSVVVLIFKIVFNLIFVVYFYKLYSNFLYNVLWGFFCWMGWLLKIWDFDYNFIIIFGF